MNADGAVQDIIQGVIRSFWPEIQNEGDHYGSYEFKLKVVILIAHIYTSQA